MSKNKTDGFVGFYYMSDASVCDDLIALFERSGRKHKGLTNAKGISSVNKKVKDSLDLTITSDNDDEIKRYLSELDKSIDAYIKDFPFVNEYSPFGMVECFNIQKYEPNQGYFEWHTERGCGVLPHNNRHLTFITYLNDVTDAGETEFYHQKIKVKPEKGLTIVFPVDWTHTHRGITSPTQVKYIATGWYDFFTT